MSDNVTYLMVLITVPSEKEAKNLAELLIKNKLAACVNSLPVESLFTWKGKIDQAKEILLIAKTKRALFKKLEKLVKKYHSYEVPEIIALPIISGYKKYLEWVKENTL